jgi:hypothetical protein
MRLYALDKDLAISRLHFLSGGVILPAKGDVFVYHVSQYRNACTVGRCRIAISFRRSRVF